MRLLRLVFGLRPELKLHRYWWHRLALVLFVVGTAFLIGYLVRYRPTLNLSQDLSKVSIGPTLKQFMDSHPNIEEPIAAFYDEPGLTGQRGEYAVLNIPATVMLQTYCSGNWQRDYPRIERRIREDASDWPEHRDNMLKAARLMAQSLGGHCLSLLNPNFREENLVKYSINSSEYAKQYAFIVLATLTPLIAWIFVALNAYYRGLIYIAFGRGSDSTSA